MTKTQTISFLRASVFALSFAPGAGLSIVPGLGFVNKKSGEKVVVFEHTLENGTGGLVWNRPTPVLLGDLNIPRFQNEFASSSLMLGCGVESTGTEGQFSIGDMAPWFWLHNMPDLEGSYLLDGARGPLFMGGNIEKAIERIREDDPDLRAGYRFKFFWKYKSWKSGQLSQEIASGEWHQVQPQDPDKVLEPFSIALSS